MSTSHTKLTRGHEEAIYALRKEEKTGREIREALALGIPGEPPVSISADRALKVARRLIDERDALYESKVQRKPPAEGLAILAKRLIVVAEKETVRMERAENAGRLDANKLGRLAGALTKLYALLEKAEAHAASPDPTANKADSQAQGAPSTPTSFGDALIEGGGAAGAEERQDAASPPVVDGVLGPPPTA